MEPVRLRIRQQYNHAQSLRKIDGPVIEREDGCEDGLLCTSPLERTFSLDCRDFCDLRIPMGSRSGACFSCVLVIFNCQSRPCVADSTRTRSSTDSESQGFCIQSPPSLARLSSSCVHAVSRSDSFLVRRHTMRWRRSHSSSSTSRYPRKFAGIDKPVGYGMGIGSV
jgi:hypothetical protein